MKERSKEFVTLKALTFLGIRTTPATNIDTAAGQHGSKELGLKTVSLNKILLGKKNQPLNIRKKFYQLFQISSKKSIIELVSIQYKMNLNLPPSLTDRVGNELHDKNGHKRTMSYRVFFVD